MIKDKKQLLIKIIFLVSVVALISAFIIEYILGHQPCDLCLFERVPYLLAIIIILFNYQFNQFEKFFILLLLIVFLIGAILSLYHLGIEQGFIQESVVCDLKNGSNLLSKEEILKQLQEKNISCKDVTFKIFGLSLTTYNILISLLICIGIGKIYFNYGKN